MKNNQKIGSAIKNGKEPTDNEKGSNPSLAHHASKPKPHRKKQKQRQTAAHLSVPPYTGQF